MADKKYIPPEVLHLMDLGRQGKLWTVEINYSLGGERRLERKRNLTDVELTKTRESIFRYGFPVPIKPGHWKIVPPFDIVDLDIYKQSAYFGG